MKDLEKEFKNLTKILNEAKKRGEVKGYVLIGGFAVSARARPRATKDIDFLVEAEEHFYKQTLPKAVAKQHCTVKTYKGDIMDPLRGSVRIFDREGQELADLIPVSWKWQNDAIQGAEEIIIFDRTVPVARIEDLIVLKLKAGGPQDLLDIEELFKAAQTVKLDKERLQELAKRARIDKKLAKYLK